MTKGDNRSHSPNTSLAAFCKNEREARSMPLTTLAEIIQASRALSPAERLQLLDAMWDAEHPDAWPALSPEWLTEVRNRSAAFDAGHMNASPWQDVQARVRRSAGLDH